MREAQRSLGGPFELPDVLVALAVLAGVTLFGIVGFVWVEGLSPFDAVYMTVITLSTVGFSEVRPLSPEGRSFAILLIVVGVGVAVTLSGFLAQGLIDLRLGRLFPRRTMNKAIEALKDHTIVCGYGRFGQMVSNELRDADVPLVVIEESHEKEPQLLRDGHLYVLGSAAADDLLEYAGVRRAKSVAVATGSDATNVFITLAAKQLHPEVQVFARGESQPTLERLRFAGATKAISAYHVGAQRMAASILRPSVVEFLEIARPAFGSAIDVEEVLLSTRSALAGRSIAEVEGELERLRVVGVSHEDGDVVFAPSARRTLAAGDRLLVVGVRESVDRLATLAAD